MNQTHNDEEFDLPVSLVHVYLELHSGIGEGENIPLQLTVADERLGWKISVDDRNLVLVRLTKTGEVIVNMGICARRQENAPRYHNYHAKYKPVAGPHRRV